MGLKGPVIATLCVLGALASSGCQRGYQSARQLESAERGPSHCAKSCTNLGMRMSAFVLVESDVAGCVCEPLQPYPPPPPGAPPPGAPAPGAPPPPSLGAPPPEAQPQSRNFRTSTGAAAGYVVLAMRRAAQQQAQQRRQQQQQSTPPPAMGR
jgi:hypothetical protein